MKRFVLLAFLALLASATFAQQQLATLNHNDSITVYYGLDALSQAHAAAVKGDIITLSSGLFNSVNITKAVTIRGAGAWPDTLGNSNTILRNGFIIDVANDSVYHLILEGIYHYETIWYKTAYNPQFIKCSFNEFVADAGSSVMRNATFINCIISYWGNYNSAGWRAQGTQFVNSVILRSKYFNSPDYFINCILQQDPGTSEMNSRLFLNCILYYHYGNTSTPSNNSYTSFNCLFIQTGTGSNYPANLFSGLAGHTLWNKRGMNTVFKSFNGDNSGSLNFELLDTIAATCLGTDGTQIGIYGGQMPFDPRVTNPAIRSINVGLRSTPDGKLAVDIEVVSDGTVDDE